MKVKTSHTIEGNRVKLLKNIKDLKIFIYVDKDGNKSESAILYIAKDEEVIGTIEIKLDSSSDDAIFSLINAFQIL